MLLNRRKELFARPFSGQTFIQNRPPPVDDRFRFSKSVFLVGRFDEQVVNVVCDCIEQQECISHDKVRRLLTRDITVTFENTHTGLF